MGLGRCSTAGVPRTRLLGTLLAFSVLIVAAMLGGGAMVGPSLAHAGPLAAQAVGEPAFSPSSPASETTPSEVALAVHPNLSPRSQAPCRPSAPAVQPTPGRSTPIYQGPAECNTVALTFDAGVDRGYAELILDILRENSVPASFGMTGAWAQHSPDLIRRMADEGHELVNHTWDHSSFTGLSSRARPLSVGERRLQLDWTDELLLGLTGRSSRPFFRPPYGDMNEGVLKDVGDAGYDYTVMWTVDSFGWNYLPAAGIVDRCLSRAEPGAIYIFHVGAQSEDALALGQIIEGLRARGLGFVTVSDLLGL